MRKTPLSVAISIALANGSLFAGAPALAQDAIEDNAQVLDEVVVTGSRISKDPFSSSTPVDVIDIEEASIQGIANVGELLRRNTTAAGSPQVTSATTSEFVQNGGVGANTLSLRGLGANRTLVLINGRRPGPSGTRGGVSSFDMNTLPLAALERIEILKDGASSIYGSDAIAGVVNLITRKDDGGTFDGFVSQPDDSGGEHTRLSASWGKNFDRGHFRVTADYSKLEELARGDRDYFTCGEPYIFDQNTGDRADTVDPRTGNFRCQDLTWGHIWIYDVGYGATNNPALGQSTPNGGLAQFDYDGDLAQYIPGYGNPTLEQDLTAPPGWFPVSYDPQSHGVTNSDHPFQNAESLVPEQEVTTFYAEGAYQLTDTVELYGEVLLNRRETHQNDYRQYWTFLTYSGNFDFYYGYGPTNGAQVARDAGWLGPVLLSPTAITDHSDTDIEVTFTRYLAGLRGDFGDTSWGWDFSVSHNVSDGDYREELLYADSIYDSEWNYVNSTVTSVGNQASCVGNVSTVRGAPCVDIPWYSPALLAGDLSPEVQEYLYGVETGNTEYTQTSVDGFVTGEVWELPAGPLGLAAGFHYREDDINDLPGEVTLAGNTWGASTAGNTLGGDSTSAVFAEFDIPVIADKPGFQNVTMNASARYTDVDSYGDDTTWKVGINWQIIDSVRIRMNKGTSFRTPALFELYLADQTGFPSQRIDPCRNWGVNLANGTINQTVADNCAADQSSIGGPAGGFAPDYAGGTISATSISRGGFGVLDAETSTSETIGIIWQPEFADLSVSIDYFDINVKSEIVQLGSSNILNGCYESDFGFAFDGTEGLCTLFDRTNANFGYDNVDDSFINIADQTNRGVDYAVRYGFDVDSWGGDFAIDLKATHQLEDKRALFPENIENLNGIIGDPEWVGTFGVSFFRGPLSVYYSGNYIGDSDSTRLLPGNGTIQYFGQTYDAVMHADSVVYHNLSVSYDWEEQGIKAVLGVANLTAEDPPQVTTTGDTDAAINFVGSSAFYSQYDWFGRRIYANLTYSFD
jgi:iron complex outermembrane receptor protein